MNGLKFESESSMHSSVEVGYDSAGLLSGSHVDKSREEVSKLRKVIAGCSALSIGLVITLIVVIVVNAAKGGSNPAAIDTTAYAKNLMSLRDTSVDACDDFYQHACGSYLKSATIPSDAVTVSLSFSVMGDRNQEVLRTIAEGGWPLVTPLYSACMDTATIDSVGLGPLQSILQEVRSTITKADLLRIVGKYKYLEQASSMFTGMGVVVDPTDTTRNLLDVAQGGLSMPLGYYTASYLPDFRIHVQNMLSLAGDSDAAAHANAIVDLEVKIAAFTLPPAELRDPQKTTNRGNLTTLVSLAPSMDWPALFSAMGIAVPGSLVLNIDVLEFVRDLGLLFDSTSLSTLQLYVSWQLQHNTAPWLTTAIRNENFAFYNQKLQGIVTQPLRWKSCTNNVAAQLSDVVSRVFVDKAFPGASKKTSQDMIKGIEQAMRQKIPGVPWMDDATKQAALLKLSLVTELIGYPDSWDSYEDVMLNATKHFDNQRQLTLRAFRATLSRLDKPVDKSLWQMTPPTVNAYYDPAYNSINFPAGILQPPFFDATYPDAANFGGIGMVMGHELSHGFDDQGRLYDGNGFLRGWWSTQSVAGYELRAKCFVDQYNAVTVGPDHVNGELTLGENIADNSGIRLAYSAWQAHQDAVGSQTPISSAISNEQLFFYSFAQTWCTLRRPEYAHMLIQTDPHSPPAARVNEPLRNFDGFQKAFNCATGKAMAPVDNTRCVLW